jgi:hypothetical protein
VHLLQVPWRVRAAGITTSIAAGMGGNDPHQDRGARSGARVGSSAGMGSRYRSRSGSMPVERLPCPTAPRPHRRHVRVPAMPSTRP